MFNSHRWSLLWTVASLLCGGCSGSAGTVPRPPPQPSVSPAPPIVTGSGTLAVNQLADNENVISIFGPHSNKAIRQLTIAAQFHVNSVAFDRREHLYIGYNDTSKDGRYLIQEINLRNWTNVRLIHVPQWNQSSVATDDQNNLYVNTKSLLGGDIKIFPR